MSCLTFPYANIRMEKAELGLVAFGGEGVLDKTNRNLWRR